MQMSYLYASDFPFKNFCKLAQHGETARALKKKHIFFNVDIFFRARAEKGIARHIDASSVVWTQSIFDWFVLSMRMQVILDSPFARPGSAPIGGGKKGEFRDWTNNYVANVTHKYVSSLPRDSSETFG